MALVKNDIPILEYDTEPVGVISNNPGGVCNFPRKAVFLFLLDEADKYALSRGCEKIGEYQTITKLYRIYKDVYKGTEVCICQAPLGASAAVQLLDHLIGHGVREIIAAGSCGALINFAENEFIVPTEALRDEGTSYHYLPPERTVRLGEKAVTAVRRALEKNNVPYTLCKVWTTDGFYRETREMVEHRRAEGCKAVDMECSAMAACARMRGAEFGQILFTADSLADVEKHDERDWGAASFSIALTLALDAVIEI